MLVILQSLASIFLFFMAVSKYFLYLCTYINIIIKGYESKRIDAEAIFNDYFLACRDLQESQEKDDEPVLDGQGNWFLRWKFAGIR